MLVVLILTGIPVVAEPSPTDLDGHDSPALQLYQQRLEAFLEPAAVSSATTADTDGSGYRFHRILG